MIDLTGKKFNRWTVLSFSHRAGQRGSSYYWLCRCDCGTQKLVTASSLTNKGKYASKSCGCYNKERVLGRTRLPDGLASRNVVFKGYKNNAESRGLYFGLSLEEFEHITQQDCFYCGTEPQQKRQHKNSRGAFVYNGIDRIDNSKGYTSDNVVPCCFQCNKSKGTLSSSDFMNWINRVCNHLKRRVNE